MGLHLAHLLIIKALHHPILHKLLNELIKRISKFTYH